MQHVKSTYRKARHGVAPLEFVMVLPFLAFLFCLILYTCRCCIRSSEEIVSTRNEVWKERYNEIGNNRFNFSNAFGFGKVVKKNTKPIETGLYFDSLDQNATANTTLITGTWDTKHVNTHVYQDLSAGVAAGSLISDLQSASGIIGNMASVESMFAKFIGGSLGSITNLINRSTADIEQMVDNAMNEKIMKARDEIVDRIMKMTPAIDEGKAFMKELGFSDQQIVFLMKRDSSPFDVFETNLNEELKEKYEQNKGRIDQFGVQLRKFEEDVQGLKATDQILAEQ